MNKKHYLNGALLALLDILTGGIFLLVYMHISMQKDLESITNKKYKPYYLMYLIGIFTLFIPCIIWISIVAEDLSKKGRELSIEGKLTSYKHMCLWNTLGLLLIVGPFIATYRFFDTVNKIKDKLL